MIFWNNAQINAQGANAFTIAVVVPNKRPDDAVRMLRGFAQAQSDINGFINNSAEGNFDFTKIVERTGDVKLKLLVVKDDDEPLTARAIANELVKTEEHEILAVSGHWSSTTSLAAAKVYTQKGMVFITPISIMDDGNPDVSSLKPYFFRANATIPVGAEALAEYMKKSLPDHKAFIFYDPGNPYYSTALKDAFKRAIGSQYQGEYQFSPSLKLKIEDTVRGIISTTQQPALVLFPSNEYAEEAVDIAIEARQQSPSLPLIGDMANLVVQDTLSRGRGNVAGMILAPSWSEGDGNSEFAQDARRLWGGNVDWTSAMSYNTVKAIATARASVAKWEKKPTSQNIQTELSKGISIPGASGDFQFQANGGADTRVQLVEICKSDEQKLSRTGVDFFEELCPK